MANKFKKIRDLAKKCVDHLTKESELLVELLVVMDSSGAPINGHTPSSVIHSNFHSKSKCIHKQRAQIKSEIEGLANNEVSNVADIAKLVEPTLQKQLEAASRRVLELTRTVETKQMGELSY